MARPCFLISMGKRDRHLERKQPRTLREDDDDEEGVESQTFTTKLVSDTFGLFANVEQVEHQMDEEENISQDEEDRMLTWIPLHVEFGRVQSRPKSERDGTTRCLFVEAASLLGPRYPGRKPTVTKLGSNAVYYRSASIGKQQKEGASQRGAKWMKQHVNQATLLRKGYHAANWI